MANSEFFNLEQDTRKIVERVEKAPPIMNKYDLIIALTEVNKSLDNWYKALPYGTESDRNIFAEIQMNALLAVGELISKSGSDKASQDQIRQYFTLLQAITRSLSSSPATDLQQKIAEAGIAQLKQLAKDFQDQDIEKKINQQAFEYETRIQLFKSTVSLNKISGLESTNLAPLASNLESEKEQLVADRIFSLADKIQLDATLPVLISAAQKVSRTARSNRTELTANEEGNLTAMLETFLNMETSYESTASDGNDVKEKKSKALSFLNKLEQFTHQVLHEHRVEAFGGDSDQRRSDFLRPSRRRLTAPDIQGEVDQFIGNFNNEIEKIEAMGRRIGSSSVSDRPSVLSASDKAYLNRSRIEISNYLQNEALTASYAKTTNTLSAEDEKKSQDILEYGNLYIEWIDRLLAASVSQPPNPTNNGTTTNSRELNADYIKADSTRINEFEDEELARAGKILWSQLFSGIKLPGDSSKSVYNNRYTTIIEELRTRSAIAGKEYLQVQATYLEDRRAFFEAVAIGTTSSMTVDYDAMFNGDGGAGWAGAKTPFFFNESIVMRLLYGNEGDPSYRTIANQEQKERCQYINDILLLSCDMLGGINKGTGKPDSFHAIQNFTTSFMDTFKGELKKRWMGKLALGNTDALTPLQDEALGLAKQMISFLDLRTYYAMPYYLAGWSPPSGDSIADTIGKTAKRFTGLKDLYAAIGKNLRGFVIPELMVREVPGNVERSVDKKKPNQKINNLKLAKFATKLFSGYYAIDLDEGVPENARVVYKPSEVTNPVPTNAEIFWLPIIPDNPTLKMPTKSRDMLLSASGSVVVGSSKDLTYKGVLSGATAVEAFVDKCQQAYPLSGDMERDVNSVTDSVSQLVNDLSPTKSISTLDNRRIANYLYLYARFSLLAFSNKYYAPNDEHYWRLYVRFLINLRAGIESAATLSIDVRDIPSEFCDRYGIKKSEPNDNVQTVSLRDYVLSLLPNGEETAMGGRIFVDPKLVKNRDVQDRIIRSVGTSFIRVLNNNEEFAELKGKKESPIAKAKEKFRARFRAGLWNQGEVSHDLHHGFHPRDDVEDPRLANDSHRGLQTFYNVIVLPPLSGEKSPVKES